MRPRQSSLGISHSAWSMKPASAGFNEAEAIKPRNHDVIPTPTQVGHRRFNEAEAIKPRNLRHRMIPDLCDLASMRPRQSSLGIRLRVMELMVKNPGFNEAEAIKPRNRVVCPGAANCAMRLQ